MSKTSKTNKFSFRAIVIGFGFSVLLVAAACVNVAAQQSTAAKPTQTTKSETRSTASQTVVDAGISDDPGVDKMLEAYSGKVRALDVVIGKLEGELKKGGMGAGTLGNFVTDGMRAQASAKLGAHVDLVVSNSGGLRKASIAPGDLRVRDIFELLPFENKLVELELTGEQLMQCLKVVVASREPQSGARIKYILSADNKPQLESASLIADDGTERSINPTATYRVITIDYLLSVSGGNFAMLKQASKQNPLGITIRDSIVEYVKAEAAAGRAIQSKLDGRFSGPKVPGPEEPR
jgi:2',3'-cyclic-nucleotide 2'-phosphodiesterase (5'-nucleotidase family)